MGRFGGSGVARRDRALRSWLRIDRRQTKSAAHVPGVQKPLPSGKWRTGPQHRLSQTLNTGTKEVSANPLLLLPLAPLWPFCNSDLEFQGKIRGSKRDILNFILQKVQSVLVR